MFCYSDVALGYEYAIGVHESADDVTVSNERNVFGLGEGFLVVRRVDVVGCAWCWRFRWRIIGPECEGVPLHGLYSFVNGAMDELWRNVLLLWQVAIITIWRYFVNHVIAFDDVVYSTFMDTLVS